MWRCVPSLLGAASLLLHLLPAAAVEPDRYPAKPLKLIIPSPPGSPPDLVGRLIGGMLAADFGQPVVVDNRPGATGIIGLEAVAKSAPDGYTLGMVALPYVVIASLVAKMPYDIDKDLAAVALINWNYQVLAVPAASPAKSVADLVALARAKPGVLRFSSGGNGTPQHLAGELFKREARLDMQHVPYKGGPAGVLAAISGEVDMTISGVGIVSPHLKSGKLRALATAAPQRIAVYAELPTFAELGYAEVQIRDWQGLVAPAGTPQKVIERLHAQIAKATATPELKARLEALGMEAASAGPEQFAAHIRSEIQRWGKLVRDAGIKAD